MPKSEKEAEVPPAESLAPADPVEATPKVENITPGKPQVAPDFTPAVKPVPVVKPASQIDEWIKGLTKAQADILAAEAARRKDAAPILSRRGMQALKEILVAKHFTPEEKVIIQYGVMTYAQIQGGNGGRPVARLYAHIPPDFNEAIIKLLNESGIGASVSVDSFVRPSAN